MTFHANSHRKLNSDPYSKQDWQIWFFLVASEAIIVQWSIWQKIPMNLSPLSISQILNKIWGIESIEDLTFTLQIEVN